MNARTSARVIGTLFLAAFVLYGVGSSLADDDGAAAVVGSALVLANSAAVVVIGVLLLRVLRDHAPLLAGGYLLARITEGSLLAVGLVAATTTTYHLAMLALATAGAPCALLLGRLRLVPRWLGLLGGVGYAALAVGSLLELADLGPDGIGLILSAPGGVFEVALGVLLVVRGFSALPPGPAAAASATATVKAEA